MSLQTATLHAMDSQPHYSDASVCSIGVFDGVHIGHRALLQSLVDDAVSRGARPIVVTFDHDPDELFCPDRVHKLLSNEERIAALREITDDVLVLHFSPALASQECEQFFDGLLTKLPGLQAIHVGENFRCGAQATCGIPEITEWGKQHDINVEAEPLLIQGGLPVSASRIRALLAEGDVRKAAEFLTRPFTLHGTVVAGAGRGHSLGFATANVEVDGSFAEMGPFVYAAYAHVDGSRYKAAVSIGEPPTYSPASQTFNPLLLEAHLLDFEGSLYGKELVLEFIDKLRPMKRFESEEELIATVKDNISWVRDNL